MELHEYLTHLYAYNYWGSHGVLTTAEGLPEAQLHQDLGHSWGSIFGVLVHMMNAEWIWLRRWHGESPQVFPDPAQFPTLPALRRYWAGLEAEMLGFLSAQTEDSLRREVVYTNTKGVRHQITLWKMMVHVPNHGTHHRGELAAMFASLGVPHSEDDWLFYFFEQAGMK